MKLKFTKGLAALVLCLSFVLHSFSQSYQIRSAGNVIPAGVSYLPICDIENIIEFYATDPIYTPPIDGRPRAIAFGLYRDGQLIESMSSCPKETARPSDIPGYQYKVYFGKEVLKPGSTYHIEVKIYATLSCGWAGDELGTYQTYPFTINCGYSDPSRWTHSIASPDAPANCVGSIAMKTDASQIFYRGSDNKLNTINYHKSPQWFVLSNSIANVAGDIAVSYDNNTVYYRGTEGKLNYFWWNNNQWNWGVLSNSITNVAGDVVVSHDNRSVYYRGTDGKLNYFWYNNNQWNWGVLSGSVTNVAGDICVSPDDKNIFYRGPDNKLYIFYYQSGWKWGVVRNDINNVAGSVRHSYQGGYVNYKGTDNKIYWVTYNNGWQFGVQNNNVADVAGDITLSNNINYINYRAADGRMKYIGYVNGSWSENGYIRYRYNNIAGDVVTDFHGNSIVYRGTDNKIYRFIAPNASVPSSVAANDRNFDIQDNISVDTKLSIFPNPASNYINVQITNYPEGKLAIHVYSINGQLVYSKSMNVREGTKNSLQIDVSQWAKGSYIIKVSSEKSIINEKIIVL